MRPYLVFVGCFLGMVFQANLHAQTVTVACSDWKPYFYQNGKTIEGSAYEIATAVMEKTDIPTRYKIQPWKRVYDNGLRKENFMIACLGRTPTRETLFQWIGPVTKGNRYLFYKLKDNPASVKSLGDLKSYKIAVLRGGHQNDFVNQNGLEKSAQTVAETKQLLRLLLKGRVQFVLNSEEDMIAHVKEQNLTMDQFEEALLAYNVAAYLALNQNTPKEIVEKVRNAYQDVSAQGKIMLK